jgi:hypothetical protein
VSQATSKILEKSGNLSTGVCPIFSLIFVNALAAAALHKNFFFFQALDDWGHYYAETANKSLIECGQTVKASNFRNIMGHWPLLDSLHLCGISLNILIRNYEI